LGSMLNFCCLRFADKPMLFAASVYASIEPDTPTTRDHVYGKGSRHRAAREFSGRPKIGNLVIVVSEQNHVVSIAQGGNLREVSFDELEKS
jgi:DNA integrity scanning protein DisA with diadenylate cyclase activity